MTRAPAPAPVPSRTRAINTLLALVVAACLGVIFADQNGLLGGTDQTPPGQTSRPKSAGNSGNVDNSGNSGNAGDVTFPDLAPKNPPEQTQTEQTQTEQSQAEQNQPAPNQPESQPTPSASSGGYGDIK